MDVASILLAAQSPDASVRQPAEQQIEAAKASNLVRHCLRHAPALSHHTLLPASLVCSAREAAWRPARRSVRERMLLLRFGFAARYLCVCVACANLEGRGGAVSETRCAGSDTDTDTGWHRDPRLA